MASELTLESTKKAAAAKSSAEIVGSIDDLLREILRRLPLKPLIRSELVSKRWRSLITNLSFLRSVISSQNPTPAGIIFSICKGLSSNAVHYFPFSADTADKSTTIIPSLERLKFNFSWVSREGRKYEIKQSCNGLLLIARYFGRSKTYCVFNPTTNTLFTLPEIDSYSKYTCSLAFEPTKSPYYKVFCIMVLRSSRSSSGLSYVNQIYIYSSSTRCWRASGECISKQQCLGFNKGVFWNGNIHWMELGKGSYFDMEDEMLKALPRLPFVRPYPTTLDCDYFGESCDHLHYVHILSMQFNVCELKKDYSEWFYKYHIDLSTVPPTPGYQGRLGEIGFKAMWNYRDVGCLCVVICGEDEKDSFMIFGAPDSWIQYNLVSKTSKILKCQMICSYPSHIDAFQYVESICPVN